MQFSKCLLCTEFTRSIYLTLTYCFYIQRDNVSNTETHSTGVKCGSFQMLLVDRYWEHPCSFFVRAVVVIGEGFGSSLAGLFTSQNCLWATFGHHHNVIINKSILGILCICICYIYTHVSICHNPY